jgi:hypothetical protein
MEDTMMHLPSFRPVAGMLIVGAALTGCGGGTVDDLQAPLLLAGVQVVSPLLDDAGAPTAGDPAAVPADPGQRALQARHATEAQAAQVISAMQAAAIPVQVDGVADAPAHALAVARGLQLEHHLDGDAPVFVRGGDTAAAARAADALVSAGFTRVFLVAAR